MGSLEKDGLETSPGVKRSAKLVGNPLIGPQPKGFGSKSLRYFYDYLVGNNALESSGGKPSLPQFRIRAPLSVIAGD